MRYLLSIMLTLLLFGCEQADSNDPQGQGAWLTLGNSGLAEVFARYADGETEKWTAPFSTQFGQDGKSLVIVLHTNQCGEIHLKGALGSDGLTRVNTTETVARALPCRLNTTQAPQWKLLTKLVNSARQ